METIKDGDFVIAKTASVLRLVELNRKKPQYFGKRKAHLFAAVGHPYGSFFEMKSDGSLRRVERALPIKVEDEDGVRDNRSLTDSGDSQKLTTSDIEGFKRQGLSGQEMVKMIVENSSSFQEKTAFAKEKYLRKKQQKYMSHLQVLRPNVRLLAEMYYMQGPLKICNLRVDSLGQILAFCNVRSGGRYMVMETVCGLLTAAALERLGPLGCVVQLHLGPFSIRPVQPAIRALRDLPEDVLLNIDLRSAMELLQQQEGATEEAPVDLQDPKTEKRLHVSKAKEVLNPRSMDSLLVAVKNHPLNVLPLLDFLAPSRPFAVFSMFQEPLVDCYMCSSRPAGTLCSSTSQRPGCVSTRCCPRGPTRATACLETGDSS